MAIIITDDDVRRHLSMRECVDAMQIAFRDFANGKAVTLLTSMTELKGFEEKAGPTRESGVQHGAIRNRVTWTDRRQADRDGCLTCDHPRRTGPARRDPQRCVGCSSQGISCRRCTRARTASKSLLKRSVSSANTRSRASSPLVITMTWPKLAFVSSGTVGK